MIDSHTHLDSCAPDDDDLIASARAVGITRMLTIGTDVISSQYALAAAARYPEVSAAVGIHPNYAGEASDAELAAIAELADDPLCRAIGETGRDNYRDRTPAADQRRAFEYQIELARATGKPLVIHTRGPAEAETIATLRERADGLRVIMHCFSMPERLDECLAEGWWISAAGHVTYPRNDALADAIARVPDNRLLVETDAPYLTPQAVRKERNRPANVIYTARFVADRRGQSYEQLEEIVSRNADELFGWGIDLP